MSNRRHILLANATRRPYREIPELPDGSAYDETSGLWRLSNGEVLVGDAAFGPGTKKCDQETGEDQKGE